MNHLLRWRDENHMLPLLLISSVVMLLAIAAGALWSRGVPVTQFIAPHSLRSAYDRVQVGRTLQGQLAGLGFDSERLQARSVSGLGVQEYFMPRTSREFDLLDPAVRSCFDTPDRCRVLIFPLAASVQTGGMMSANAAPAEPGRIVFLLRKGRVAFKEMHGV
ncbi:MAG: hypothetical protein JWN16_1427 [Alphaproteobacteria bacterium]|nr:hypothetical protein [Alphaproteobacteria bacterium]